ncbi:FAD-binding domain-containing protein [Lentinus tigrinus ALCF2SS1-7]|uniref:FAD-binding domain-containing protein n=1 Tax=Lentinus tigrinus ALCF2SS1-6 TaxID=1328759 RepID=A0A5C2SDB5_9APHY|nr:FAD-binding domain-containing protein [Lentinus tigrinus ALCF2SS1-6]RPD75196.1 FAD-binding domain-containing protein [Lentinus tigrinus ALCF2SS1-7]
MSQFSLLSFFVFSATLHAATAAQSQCRCLYGDPCWPSDGDFADLATQVSQPLIHPVPPAQPCYTSANSSECATVVANWNDGDWRANQTGSMEASNFETFTFSNGTIEACYLNTTLGVPCGQGSVPVIGVDARSVEDVQAAVKFASDHNLRLAVKNTGHDYCGRSDGRGSFMVWTHNLKNITVHPSFTPAGAPSNETYESAISLGSGVQWHEAYSAANVSGRALVGGTSIGGSVGAAGGWLLGGGHSSLSPSFGLGVDNVLEFSVVTANGTYLVTNAHKNSDLFWALRGGGGGTFGIVTSITYRTRPTFPIVAAFLTASANTSTPNAALSQAFTEVVRITPQLTDEGWGGYVVFNNPTSNSTSFAVITVVPAASSESAAQANATMTGYLEYVKALAANSTQSGDPAEAVALEDATTVVFDTWYDWYVKTWSTGLQDGVGDNGNVGSWLIPRDLVESDHEHVAETLLTVPGLGWYIVAGGAVSNVSADDTGLNPAWRKAAAHTPFGITWSEGATSDELNALRDTFKSNLAKVRALAPESGAYLNEASPYEPDPAHSFFGSHYEKLRAIKAIYDPTDLFIVLEGVASDEWDESLTCRK